MRQPSVIAIGQRSVAAWIWLLIAALASLKLTAAALVFLAAAIVGGYLMQANAAWILAAPLALLSANLAAAIAVNRLFRRQLPLLLFHIALLAVVVLVAAGRLMYLNGRLELTNGEAFAGELLDAEHGPFHLFRLHRLAFVNEGFELEYAAGLRREDTRNRVRWWDLKGEEHVSVVGDHTPLVLEGYRFYTTSNKGFAPVFLWQPAGGPAARGALHMPSYPLLESQQQVDWQLPGTQANVAVRLHIDEVLIDPEKPSRFRLPTNHRLEIEADGTRHSLQPGDLIEVGGGRLRYERLTTWMGYSVFSDWTLPWLLAASLVAAASLAWYYWRRFFARPWK